MTVSKNTAEMITLMQKHFDADAILGGKYDHGNGKFCNIACLAGGADDIDFIENQYGIPKAAMRLQEGIFESLPDDEQSQFALDCANAIGTDGKDLSLIVPKMMLYILERLPKQDCITVVIDLYKRVVDGEDIEGMREEFADAARAADAAAYAAYAAARAAERQKQKNKLLQLFKDAPILEAA